jgi:hypothetical protein
LGPTEIHALIDHRVRGRWVIRSNHAMNLAAWQFPNRVTIEGTQVGGELRLLVAAK